MASDRGVTLCEVSSRLVTDAENDDKGAVRGWRLPVRASHCLRTPREGRPIGYAIVELGVIAAAEEAKRQADVTVFEPTGAAGAVTPRDAASADWNVREASTAGAHQGLARAAASGLLQLLQSPRATLASWFLPSGGDSGSAAGAGRPLAWHPRRQWLAAPDAEGRRVLILDYETAGRVLPGAPMAPPQTRAILQHDLQRQVAAVAWRPHGGGALAVGCAGGICLWTLGRGASTGTSVSASMAFLRVPGQAAVIALAWSPSGHLLASACAGIPGFCVWDVARGISTPLAAGLERLTELRWSPNGCYLVAGGGGSLCVWETQRWRHSRWAWPAPASLVSTAWSPDSRVLLLAFEDVNQMAALQFIGVPPALPAQLMPLQLPGLAASSQGGGRRMVRTVAWDASAQRLAVSLGTAEQPCVALYTTSVTPVFTARLIGLLQDQPSRRDGAVGPSGVSAPAAGEPVMGEGISGEGDIEREQEVGIVKAGAVSLAFQGNFAGGSLLAVRRSDAIRVLPLYYTT